MDTKRTIKVYCLNCGGGERNHQILKKHVNKGSETIGKLGEGGHEISWNEQYEIITCLGCDSVRFREEKSFSEHDEPTINIYPEIVSKGREALDTDHFPSQVARIYIDTVKTLNCGANILSGAGLRAIVEAICKDKKVAGSDLEKKIDALRADGILARAEADLLHEERYIGNTALHEIEAPSASDLRDGLDIIEGMLSTIYILPEKAARLRAAREKRKEKTPGKN